MNDVEMKKVIGLVKVYENDENGLKKEFKRLESVKCRSKKRIDKKEFKEKYEMSIKELEVLKMVRNEIKKRKGVKNVKVVYELSKEDIDNMDLIEIIKSIRNIDSKRCNLRYINDNYKKDSLYLKCEEIKIWLLNRKKELENMGILKKEDIMKIIENNNFNDREKIEKIKGYLSKF